MASITEHLRRWKDDGWNAAKTGSGHWRLTHPDARTPVFAAATPSDWRATLNTEAELRRALRQNPENGEQPPQVISSSDDIIKQKKKKLPSSTKRAASDFFMMDHVVPATNFASRLPKRGEWVDDGDIFEIVKPLELLMAWSFAYMRLRLDGKDANVIRVLRARFRTDEDFRSKLLKSFRESSPEEFRMLRVRLLGRGENVQPEKPSSLLSPSVHNNHHRPTTQNGKTSPSLPNYTRDDTDAAIKVDLTEDPVLRAHREAVEQAAKVAEEKRKREQYIASLEQRVASLEGEVSEAKIKRIFAERVRDDMEQCMVDNRTTLRETEKKLRAAERALLAVRDDEKHGEDLATVAASITNKSAPPALKTPVPASSTPEMQVHVVHKPVVRKFPEGYRHTASSARTAMPITSFFAKPADEAKTSSKPTAFIKPTTVASTEGERIRATRKTLGLSQAALGSLIGVSGVSVSLWETGRTNVSDWHLPALLKALKVSAMYLRTGRGS